MAKAGPKELQTAALRIAKFSDIPTKLLRGHPDCVVKDRPRKTKKTPPAEDAGVTLAPPLSTQKAIAADLADPPKTKPREEDMKKATKAKTKTVAKKAPKKPAAASRRAAPAKAKKPAAGKAGGVSTKAIADYICSFGDKGVSTPTIVAQFGVKEHPLRAKIYYAKHTLGYKIDHDGEVYKGTAPA